MKTLTKKDVNIVNKKLKLNKKSKILNLSHDDMDGSGSVIPLYNYFENLHTIRVKYDKINDYAEKINYNKYDAVIFTDISPSNPDIIKDVDNLIILDHHETAKCNHDPENMRFVYVGESASKLSQKFISMCFNEDLSYLDDLMKYINDYDMWIDPYGASWLFNTIHFYYCRKDRFTYTKFVKRFCNGDVNFNTEEQNHLIKRKNELEVCWEKFKDEHYGLPHDINGALIFSSDFMNEMCHRLMDNYKYDLVISIHPRTFRGSVRCNNEDVSVGKVLKELEMGGGHGASAGFYNKDMLGAKNNIDMLCKHLSENYEFLVVNE